MPKPELIKEGDILYDVRGKDRWTGNPHWWEVKILKLNRDETGQVVSAEVSWNHNRPTQYGRRNLERLRRQPPKKRS